MSREIITIFRCDLCSGVIEGRSEADVPVRLSVGLRHVDLDLCDADAQRLTEAVGPFLEAGRPPTLAPGPQAASGAARGSYAPPAGRTRRTSGIQWRRYFEEGRGYRCPECDPAQFFSKPSAIGMHWARAHGGLPKDHPPPQPPEVLRVSDERGFRARGTLDTLASDLLVEGGGR